MNDTQFQLMITNTTDRTAVEKALAPVIAARATLHDLELQLTQKQQAIDRLVDEQKRLRENLKDLKDSPEERALGRRYAGEMNADEDQLDTLKKQRADLEPQRAAAQKALDDAIRSLHLSENL
jgi:predicted  nucleic acid-binding Zn-ribbon protein